MKTLVRFLQSLSFPSLIFVLFIACGPQKGTTNFTGSAPVKPVSAPQVASTNSNKESIASSNSSPVDPPPSSDQSALSSSKNSNTADIPSTKSRQTSCINVPANSQSFESKVSGTATKNTIFHRVVAVDPSKTGIDASDSYGLKPFSLSSNETMSSTVFQNSTTELQAMLDNGVKEIEYVAFAHQFLRGLDRIKITIEVGGKKFEDISKVNVYSAYGYLSIKNIRSEDKKIIGDISMKSFNYDPAETGKLYDKIRSVPVSAQDATDIIGSASDAADSNVSEKGINLDGLKVTIDIDATLYDSVQYRAIRMNLWSQQPLSNPCISSSK